MTVMCFKHIEMLDSSFHSELSKYLLAILRILMFSKQKIIALFSFVLYIKG